MPLVLTDQTSNNNDLTNNNTVSVGASTPFGASSTSADIETDSTQYLSITDAAQTGLDLSGDLTFEFWVNFETIPTVDEDNRTLINKSAAGDLGYSFLLRRRLGSNFLRTNFYEDNSTLDGVRWNLDRDGTAFSTGTWYFIALTFDVSEPAATEWELWVGEAGSAPTSQGNGDFIDETANISSIQNTGAEFRIGADATEGTRFDGQMDEVRIWNDIRTSTEISDNYQSELVGNEAGLVAYWPFEALGARALSSARTSASARSAASARDSATSRTVVS